MARLRWDIVLTMVICSAIMTGTNVLTTNLVDQRNKAWLEGPKEEVVSDGKVGSIAASDTPRLITLEEIRSCEGSFTMELADYQFDDCYTYGDSGIYYIQPDLDKEEYIFAKINMQSADYLEHPMRTLPIGKVVHEAPPSEHLDSISEQFEAKDRTVHTDFYVDMEGGQAPVFKKLPDAKKWGANVSMLALVLSWILIRWITVKIGLFPPILPPRKSKNDADN